MSISQTFARCLSTAAVTCSILAGAFVAPAQAAVIVSFDPAFGPSIPNLGFRGTATLDVSNGCYQTTGFVTVGGTCTISVLSARVDYYNVSHTPAVNIPTSNVFDNMFFQSGYVVGAYIDPTTHLLTGIDTDDSPSFGVDVTDDQPGTANDVRYLGNMVLYFTSGHMPPPIITARMSELVTTDATTVPGVGGAFLRCQFSEIGNCENVVSNQGTVTFTQVPEPGSLALAALGLVALAVRRRRHA